MLYIHDRHAYLIFNDLSFFYPDLGSREIGAKIFKAGLKRMRTGEEIKQDLDSCYIPEKEYELRSTSSFSSESRRLNSSSKLSKIFCETDFLAIYCRPAMLS